MKFPVQFQQTRKALGLAQKEAARRVGVCERQVREWESGRDLPAGVQQSRILLSLRGIKSRI